MTYFARGYRRQIMTAPIAVQPEIAGDPLLLPLLSMGTARLILGLRGNGRAGEICGLRHNNSLPRKVPWIMREVLRQPQQGIPQTAWDNVLVG